MIPSQVGTIEQISLILIMQQKKNYIHGWMYMFVCADVCILIYSQSTLVQNFVESLYSMNVFLITFKVLANKFILLSNMSKYSAEILYIITRFLSEY